MDANQARRRGTDLGSRPVSGTSTASSQHYVETFTYSALPQDKDCTRLVRVEPAGNNDDPISCILIDVVFGDRPKYQALSYMWGDETSKLKILLNGTEFRVTQNLFDALQFLRREPKRGPVWIDAISINQANIPERNRQLQMMPYIYVRAHTVLVWLGKKYAKYESADSKECVETGPEPARKNTLDEAIRPPTSSTVDADCSPIPAGDGRAGGEAAFAEEVRTDRYWDRVWIIQEIGRAYRIQVCFGHRRIMDWESFIKLIAYKAPKERFGGPYHLDELRKQKYKGGHSLRNLLENHRDALCTDQRDKVYGLVGLAADARGFPMDYGKREIDVWTDTMRFMNDHGLLQSSDLVEFGRMVRGLLLGPGMEPVHSVAHPSPWDSTRLVLDGQVSRNTDVFTLRAYIYGYIQYLGPTTTDVVSSLQLADEWAMALQANFPEDLSHAHWESDNLMRKILDADEASLAKSCHNHMSCLCWRRQTDGYNNQFRRAAYNLPRIRQMQEKKSLPKFTAASKLRDDNDRYLFQLNCLSSVKTPYKTGIASSQAEPGDLVCWIPGVKQAVLVRVSFGSGDEVHLQVCGTARITCDFEKEAALEDKKRACELLELDILVDAHTLFVILAS
ncbi:hypothetical protein V499_09216 [Pseudogymnoascus sp. VKM F-103]|nr:hypothetical protein V499_09216 [Pseudogymnoascus sp. VKM F-103]